MHHQSMFHFVFCPIEILLMNNEYCLQLNWGGKVPQEMYTVRDAKDNNNDDFVDTVIKKGSKLKLDFLCEDASCVLK